MQCEATFDICPFFSFFPPLFPQGGQRQEENEEETLHQLRDGESFLRLPLTHVLTYTRTHTDSRTHTAVQTRTHVHTQQSTHARGKDHVPLRNVLLALLFMACL